MEKSQTNLESFQIKQRSNIKKKTTHIQQKFTQPKQRLPSKQLKSIFDNEITKIRNSITDSRKSRRPPTFKENLDKLIIQNGLKTQFQQRTVFQSQNFSAAFQSIDSRDKLSELTKQVFNTYPLLSSMNIPSLKTEYNLTRAQLYNYYTKFKALIVSKLMQLQDVQEGEKINWESIDMNTFKSGILQDYAGAPPKYIENIFHRTKQNNMNWHNFMKVIKSIQATNILESMSLLIELIDKEKHATLSFSDIYKLSESTFEMLIPSTDQNVIDELSQMLTENIFEIMEASLDQEIEWKQIKKSVKKVQEKNDSSLNLLLLLCFIKKSGNNALLKQICESDLKMFNQQLRDQQKFSQDFLISEIKEQISGNKKYFLSQKQLRTMESLLKNNKNNTAQKTEYFTNYQI